MAQLRAAEPADLESGHVLAVPEDVTPQQVEDLALAYWPAARWDASGALALTRHSGLSSPLALPRWVARTHGLPEHVRWGYRLEVNPERGTPPPPGTIDPLGIAPAFPQGPPVREEARILHWAVAAARHVGGAVRLAPSGTVLQPRASDAPQRQLYSDVWLAPDAGELVCRGIFPGMRLATAPVAWTPPPDPAQPLAPGVRMDPTQLRELHRAATQFDREVAAQGAFLDGYSVVLDARERGTLAVEVGPCETVPVPVAKRSWDLETLTCYRIVWAPRDELQALDPQPSPAVATLRQWAASSIALLGEALRRTCGGVLLDEAGLPL